MPGRRKNFSMPEHQAKGKSRQTGKTVQRRKARGWEGGIFGKKEAVPNSDERLALREDFSKKTREYERDGKGRRRKGGPVDVGEKGSKKKTTERQFFLQNMQEIPRDMNNAQNGAERAGRKSSGTIKK